MKHLGKLALLWLVLLAPAAQIGARAQEQCRLPSQITVAPCPNIGREESRGSKGDFDLHILSFSWSPGFCETPAGRHSTLQCRDNRFDWVVHGLWPQYAAPRAGQRWPQYCGPVAPVPAQTLRRHLCASPDPKLMQCEWAKHGSCSDFATPEQYFAAIEDWRAKLVLPAPQPGQTAGALAAAVVAANRRLGLERRHLQVQMAKDGGIRELRLCLARDLSGFVSCRG